MSKPSDITTEEAEMAMKLAKGFIRKDRGNASSAEACLADARRLMEDGEGIGPYAATTLAYAACIRSLSHSVGWFSDDAWVLSARLSTTDHPMGTPYLERCRKVGGDGRERLDREARMMARWNR